MYKTDKIKKPLKIEILKITVAFLFTDALLASGIGFQQDKTRSRLGIYPKEIKRLKSLVFRFGPPLGGGYGLK